MVAGSSSARNVVWRRSMRCSFCVREQTDEIVPPSSAPAYIPRLPAARKPAGTKDADVGLRRKREAVGRRRGKRAARSQHAIDLPQGRLLIPHVLDDVERNYRIGGAVAEWERFRVSGGEIEGNAGRREESAGHHQPLERDVDADQRPSWALGREESASSASDIEHGFCVVESGTVSRTRKLLRPFHHSALFFTAAAQNLGKRALRREPAYPGLRELVRRFHAAADSGGPPPIAARETIAVAAARDQLLAAAGADYAAFSSASLHDRQ
ncbi:hypothetical protein BH23GEM3_BH23GEM3_10100 [soil metagenome]